MAASSSTCTLSTLDSDIIQTHILARLDGPSLAAMSCTSSQFLALSADEKLWQEICSAQWGSTDDSRVRQVISTFPGGHRFFFSNSFPLLSHLNPSSNHNRLLSLGPSDVISAVDICYKKKLILTKIRETNTTTTKFLRSPFKIELLAQNDDVSIPIQRFDAIDLLLEDLKENLSLSWIVIDPIGKRAGNLSSGRPVMVEWPCTAGEVQLHYVTIMAKNGGPRGEDLESVECTVMVTCSGVDEGEVHVDDVRLEIKDIGGRSCDGRESLVILEDALANGRRMIGKKGDCEEKYKIFEKRKREGKVKEPSRYGVVHMVCFPIVVLVTFCFTLFLFLVLYMQSHVTKRRNKIRNYYA